MSFLKHKVQFALCIFIIIIGYSAFSQSIKDASYYKSKGFQVFPDYSLAVKMPVILKDVSGQTKEHHDCNYGAMADEYSKEKRAFYQVIIDRLPASFGVLSKAEQDAYIDKIYTSSTGVTKKVVFGAEKLTAFVMSFKQNGMTGKGIIIVRNGNNYGFTLITNYKLLERFNTLTNSIEFIAK